MAGRLQRGVLSGTADTGNVVASFGRGVEFCNAVALLLTVRRTVASVQSAFGSSFCCGCAANWTLGDQNPAGWRGNLTGRSMCGR